MNFTIAKFLRTVVALPPLLIFPPEDEDILAAPSSIILIGVTLILLSLAFTSGTFLNEPVSDFTLLLSDVIGSVVLDIWEDDEELL